MNPYLFASSRRRATVLAVAFALVVGAAALVVVDGTDSAAVAPVSAAVAAPVPPPTPVPPTIDVPDAAPRPDVSHAVVVITPDGVAADAAPTAATDDPFADVIVEPVDPAEALFGDHAAVAVSD
jgi:hypothetical protein